MFESQIWESPEVTKSDGWSNSCKNERESAHPSWSFIWIISFFLALPTLQPLWYPRSFFRLFRSFRLFSRHLDCFNNFKYFMNKYLNFFAYKLFEKDLIWNKCYFSIFIKLQHINLNFEVKLWYLWKIINWKDISNLKGFLNWLTNL